MVLSAGCLAACRALLSAYGERVIVHAYGNHSTFKWVPPAVRLQRQEARAEVKAEAARVGNRRASKGEAPGRAGLPPHYAE